MEWREVSEAEFYSTIGPQDVHPRILPGSWPWTSVYVTPHGIERGQVIDITTAGGGTIRKIYKLPIT